MRTIASWLSTGSDCVLLLCGATRAADPAFVVTGSGYGPVTIGMSVHAASAALGLPLAKTDETDEPSCYLVAPVSGLPGLKFMVIDGEVARVELAVGSSIATDRSLRVGDAETSVRAAHAQGELQVEPHQYIGQPALYLTNWNEDAGRGTRYVTDETAKVIEIRGGNDSIYYNEGCA